MKKTLLIALIVLALPGCKDKDLFQEAVLEEMKADQDLKSYKIEPEYMAECVVETSSQNMPGVFALDPARLTAFRNYTKMLTVPKSADPKKTMEELRNDFGSARGLADAHSNYIESIQQCITTVISKTEEKEKK